MTIDQKDYFVLERFGGGFHNIASSEPMTQSEALAFVESRRAFHKERPAVLSPVAFVIVKVSAISTFSSSFAAPADAANPPQ